MKTLADSSGPLLEAYDILMFDLDGVVYIGDEAVEGAAAALRRAAEMGSHLAYVTNNASRTPKMTADRLRGLGMPVGADSDVVTSAQAAAHMVANLVPAGSEVLVVGTVGLYAALRERDLVPVDVLSEQTAAFVQGFNPDTTWQNLAEGAYAVHGGLPWVASNTDLTLPTARGITPGNGSLVQAIINATGQRPHVAGKPQRALFDETTERVGGSTPLVVGDRLDTDIEGANNIDADSMAVLTGVSSLQNIADAPPRLRPTFVAPDLGGLFAAHPAVTREGETVVCGGARVASEGKKLVVHDRGAHSIELIRAALTLAWHTPDHTMQIAEVEGYDYE